MKIESGLFDAMVLQRVKGNVSDAIFSGETAAKISAPVRAKVTSRGRAVRGFSSATVGRVTKGKIAGRLKGLPVGGPYDIELSVDVAGGKETLNVRNVLVGDVWILAGQSNMQGCAWQRPAMEKNPLVRAFYMIDKWDVAEDPLHELGLAVDPVHKALGATGKTPKGFGRGPGVAFGQAMHAATNVPQGLIACAHGGTSMAQWDPALKKLGGESLFGATVRRLKKNGGKVAGVIWYQGCSDALPDEVGRYESRMKTLVAAFRRECGDAKLPFVMVQIARVFQKEWFTAKCWNAIQESQRKLPTMIKNLACVPAIDLQLDDCIHIGGRGQIRLGFRLAQATLALTQPKLKQKLPIEIDKMEVKSAPNGMADIHVSFKNVIERLEAPGLPQGFALVDSAGEDMLGVFDVELDGTKAIVHTSVPVAMIGMYCLSYGHGLAPVCNITDGVDRSLPVFSRQYFGGGVRAITPWALQWKTSKLMKEITPVDKLKMPDVKDRKLAWTKNMFTGWLASRHEEIVKESLDVDRMMHFATTMSCSEAMNLKFMFGYDGPFVMWLDGKRVVCDPKGINPIIVDQHSFVAKLAKGEHRIVVSMCTNKSLAWGFCLRMERLDVSASKIRKGPLAYAMPEFNA